MNRSEIQLRLYRAILIAGIILSLISIIGNILSQFPMRPNLKWGILLIISIAALIFSNNKKWTPYFMFAVFGFLICVFLPFAFIDSGGSKNNAIGYTFLLLISVTYLFNGKKRWILVIALIISFMALHALEYYKPDLIAVYSDKNQFMDRMLQIPLLLFASFWIIRIFAKEYEKVHEKLTVYANYDELTGLYNRRIFNLAMEEAVNEGCEKYLVFLDLDNFKKVNDNYGHCVGDEALKKLSEILEKNIDLEKHVVCRWGGDEFAIIYNGNREDLICKLETIRAMFKSYISVYDESTGLSYSILSFGEADRIPQMISAADKLLYEEKLKKEI